MAVRRSAGATRAINLFGAIVLGVLGLGCFAVMRARILRRGGSRGDEVDDHVLGGLPSRPRLASGRGICQQKIQFVVEIRHAGGKRGLARAKVSHTDGQCSEIPHLALDEVCERRNFCRSLSNSVFDVFDGRMLLSLLSLHLLD